MLVYIQASFSFRQLCILGVGYSINHSDDFLVNSLSLARTNTLAMDLEHSYIFPKFGELPRIPNTPQGCLWGFYGKKDEVGGKQPLLRKL
jgi:hypothetical protein